MGDTTVRDRSKGSNPKALKKGIKALGMKYLASPVSRGNTKDIDTSKKATKKTARQSKNIEDATFNLSYQNLKAENDVRARANPKTRVKNLKKTSDENTKNINLTTNGMRMKYPDLVGARVKNVRLDAPKQVGFYKRKPK